MSQPSAIFHPKLLTLPMILLILQLSSDTALAGTLAVGAPQISGNQYTFPILLDSASNDVAVMDFHFQYDPLVFHPVEAQAGAQADYSNKMVNANQASPGEYIVVLWGPNQSTLNSGEVARITMQYTGADTPNTSLGISGLTMANADGVEVTSQTQNLDMQFESPSDNDPDTTPPPVEKPETPQGTDGETPETSKSNTLLPSALALDTEGRDSSPTPKRDASQYLDHGISQITKKNQEARDGRRLAQLAQNAQNLRESLPTPDASQPQSVPPSNAKLDAPKKNGIIPVSSGADGAVEGVDDGAKIGQLTRAGGVEPIGRVNSPDEAVFGAENRSFRNVLYVIGGGVFIGLILLLFLRKKIFA